MPTEQKQQEARIKKIVSRVLHAAGERTGRKAVKWYGTFREKEAYSMIPRANYAYGMLRAADLARFAGKKKATVCEFGVATGNGLMNMVDLAERIKTETGIQLRVVGFDSGHGLPVVMGHKDHPELWSPGDFPMTNRAELERRVANRAELIFGDISETVDGFVSTLNEDAPLGFVSVDVDIYTGAKDALRCLGGAPELYTPGVSIYFDDTNFFFANRWCGELRAIEEFNEDHEMRKIDQDRSLPGHRPDRNAGWHSSMFVCHILDHDMRTKPVSRPGYSLGEHFALMKDSSLY